MPPYRMPRRVRLLTRALVRYADRLAFGATRKPGSLGDLLAQATPQEAREALDRARAETPRDVWPALWAKVGPALQPAA